MKKIFCLAVSGMVLGGCSHHPITTGAGAYWEVAHMVRADARNHLEVVAANRYYPDPNKIELDPAAKAGFSHEIGMPDAVDEERFGGEAGVESVHPQKTPSESH